MSDIKSKANELTALAPAMSESFEHVADFAKVDMMQARGEIMKLGGLAVDTCEQVIPLLKVEIFRDFAQIISVVFASCYFEDIKGYMYDAKRWFGGITSSISIDFGTAFSSDEAVLYGVITIAVLAVITIFLFLWVVFKSGISKMKVNTVRQGHEAIRFEDAANENSWTVFFVNMTMILTLSVYLPFTQSCFQIFFCDKSSFLVQYLVGSNQCDASIWPPYGPMLAVAVIIFVIFSIGLPWFLLNQIQAFKPKGSVFNENEVHDADGETVIFDDRVYNEMVETDLDQQANPFRNLYRGYERNYSTWKISMVLYKLMLVIVVTWMSSKNASRMLTAVITCLFMIGLAIFTYYASPFVDPLNDVMDSAGRITTVVSSFAAVLTVGVGDSASASNFFGLVVIFAGVINFITMTVILFSGIPSFRTWLKNQSGKLSFYDSSLNLKDISAEQAISTWQVDREVRHRVWQAFWDGVITKNCSEEAAQRLIKLKSDAKSYGIEYITDHWTNEHDHPEQKQIRLDLRNKYEGVDVYWPKDKGCRDGHLDSETKFGKMYIHNYPFHLVIVYDDCLDESYLHEPADLKMFLEYQEMESTKRAVRLRRIVRCVAAAMAQPEHDPKLANQLEPTYFSFPVIRPEGRRVPDGTESYTGSDGKRQTRTVYSNITIDMHYSKCKFQLLVNDDISHSSGFDLALLYGDGYGKAKKPRTGDMYRESEVAGEFDANLVGFVSKDGSDGPVINYNEVIQEQVDLFLQEVKNNGIEIESLLENLDEEDRIYRQDLQEKFQNNRNTLSNKFWYAVYNNTNITRPDLEKFLEEFETNDFLKTLPKEHASALDYLYSRMDLVNKDDASRTWFTFWDDLWQQNKDVFAVKENKWVLDTSAASAIAYKSPDREKCEDWVRNIYMLSTCSKELISPATLDLLYDRMKNPTKYPIKDYQPSFSKGFFGKFMGKSEDAATKSDNPIMTGYNGVEMGNMEKNPALAT